jgi:hypothetical protein
MASRRAPRSDRLAKLLLDAVKNDRGEEIYRWIEMSNVPAKCSGTSSGTSLCADGLLMFCFTATI